jgi:hypothetical protein
MNKRRVGLVAGWIVAASLAMLLASQAVAMVRDQVTDRPSRAAATLALETTSSTTNAGTAITRQTTTTSTTIDQAQTTTTAPAETTTTTVPEATSTSVPTTSSTTPSINEEATFYLVGGWATVRCAGDDVMLTTYAPNLGYHVDIESVGPAEVEIKFEEAGGDHRSKLEAQCRGGVLQHDVDERDDD